MNKFLRRTPEQYSATLKIVQKLKKLNIILTKEVPKSARKETQVFINKDIVNIYGDDEFREWMLKEWDKDTRKYIEIKLKGLIEQKEKKENEITMMKKGKRRRKEKGNKND